MGMIAKWVGTEGEGRGGAKIKSPGISFSFVKFWFVLSFVYKLDLIFLVCGAIF